MDSLIGDAGVLSSASLLPFLCITNSLNWSATYGTSVLCIAIFALSWSIRVTPYVRKLSEAIIGIFFLLTLINGIHSTTIQTEILLSIGLIYLTCFNKKTSQAINTGKTVIFDWIVVGICFPVAAFLDVLTYTQYFVIVVAYFVGSNGAGFGVVKAMERLWNTTFRTSNEESMRFGHLLKMPRTTWKKLDLQMFSICLWLMLYFLINNMIAFNSGEVSMWQISFVIGFVSTLVCYFGPMGAEATISLEQWRDLQDKPSVGPAEQ
eukprot:TRINITY_DN8387_c0_g1_i1.p1 TRINITY_DN8387_c0_g1~~TRINITY_DN8387_c0_g1_i1.p1  ORF type:complete len:275 (+),score=21.32 TRINITY_DN8387_c0_g1_i1:35-826(+)